MNKSWCYYFHGITFIWLFSLHAALHLKLSMISDFIWLCKCKSFINSVLLPQMFRVEFHDIEYEVVYWRWTELRDLGVGVTVIPEMPWPPHSHAVGVLLLAHTQSGSYSSPEKKLGVKHFPHLCCVGRTLEQMAGEHNVLRLETEKFRSPQIERNQSTVPSEAGQTVCRA